MSHSASLEVAHVVLMWQLVVFCEMWSGPSACLSVFSSFISCKSFQNSKMCFIALLKIHAASYRHHITFNMCTGTISAPAKCKNEPTQMQKRRKKSQNCLTFEICLMPYSIIFFVKSIKWKSNLSSGKRKARGKTPSHLTYLFIKA